MTTPDIFRAPPEEAVEAMRQAAFDRWLADDTPGEPWCDEYALRLIPAMWPVAMRHGVEACVAVVRDRQIEAHGPVDSYSAGQFDTQRAALVRLRALLPAPSPGGTDGE